MITDIPIPGCRTAERVEENAAAAELQLAADDIKAIRQLVENASVQGPRYYESFMQYCFGDSLPLDQWKGDE